MGYIYKTNHDYFSSVETEEQAYLLGLIFADGSVRPSKGNRQGRLQIALQEKDGYIFKNFRKLVDKEHIILHPPAIKNKGWKARAVFDVTSSKIVEDLKQLGCVPNKSKIGMTFPYLEMGLVPHFIRGFFDGDGCVSIHTSKNYSRLRITFTCSDKKFLETLFSYIPCEKMYIKTQTRVQDIYHLCIERKEEVRNLLQYMYKDSSIFLERKKNKVEEYNMSIKSQANRIRLEGLETT